MSLLAWERRIAVDIGVEIAGEHVLDHPCHSDLFGPDIRQLNPILEQVVSYPKYGLISAFTTLFLTGLGLLLGVGQ